MSKLKELIVELKTEKTTFSRNDLDKVVTALLNEVDHKTTVYKTKNGETISEEIMPVKEFRKGLKDVLLKFGVDKQDAEKIMGEFKFSKADWFYPVISEIITSYLETGHKFSFLPKEDFIGSILIKDVEEHEREFINPKTKEKFKKKVPAHKALFKQSSVPSWKK